MSALEARTCIRLNIEINVQKLEKTGIQPPCDVEDSALSGPSFELIVVGTKHQRHLLIGIHMGTL